MLSSFKSTKRKDSLSPRVKAIRLMIEKLDALSMVESRKILGIKESHPDSMILRLNDDEIATLIKYQQECDQMQRQISGWQKRLQAAKLDLEKPELEEEDREEFKIEIAGYLEEQIGTQNKLDEIYRNLDLFLAKANINPNAFVKYIQTEKRLDANTKNLIYNRVVANNPKKMFNPDFQLLIDLADKQMTIYSKKQTKGLIQLSLRAMVENILLDYPEEEISTFINEINLQNEFGDGVKLLAVEMFESVFKERIELDTLDENESLCRKLCCEVSLDIHSRTDQLIRTEDSDEYHEGNILIIEKQLRKAAYHQIAEQMKHLALKKSTKDPAYRFSHT